MKAEREFRFDENVDEENAAIDQVISDIKISLDKDGDKFERDVPADEYDRTITVHFPQEVEIAYDVAYIEVPIRDFLTWFAEKNQEHAVYISELRDDFYAGDDEFDYHLDVGSSRDLSTTPEMRAVAKVARSRGREQRAAKRSALEAEYKAEVEAEKSTWLPDLALKETLEAERLELFDERPAALDAEWESFVLDRESWGADRPVREVARRTELDKKVQDLIRDQTAWSDRWYELRSRVLRTRET
jgi:hypothetical protein